MANEAKYHLIIDWVKAQMADGTLSNGDRLPSEKELSEQFGLSRQTVRHATGVLEKQKIVTRVRGSGTYIGGAYMPVRSEKYMNIAVVSTFYENYIFPPTIRGIERVLSKNGYTMQVSFTDNRVSREQKILETILKNDNIDGLIIEPAKSALPSPNLKYFEQIRARHIPIICFNATFENVGMQLPCVRLNDEEAGYQAARQLIDAGHKEIGGIFKLDDRQGPLRYAGFMRAVIEANVHVSQDRIFWLDTPLTQELSPAAPYVFERFAGITGLVCYNDAVAFQVMELSARKGMRIPDDLSIVGIDDASPSGPGWPALTTIPHPKEQLGRKTAENLLELLRNPEFDANYLYDAVPLVRESLKKL